MELLLAKDDAILLSGWCSNNDESGLSGVGSSGETQNNSHWYCRSLSSSGSCLTMMDNVSSALDDSLLSMMMLLLLLLPSIRGRLNRGAGGGIRMESSMLAVSLSRVEGSREERGARSEVRVEYLSI